MANKDLTGFDLIIKSDDPLILFDIITQTNIVTPNYTNGLQIFDMNQNLLGVANTTDDVINIWNNNIATISIGSISYVNNVFWIRKSISTSPSITNFNFKILCHQL